MLIGLEFKAQINEKYFNFSLQAPAESILDNKSVRENAVIWNVMLTGFASNRYLSLALELFIEMLDLGVRPDSSTMVANLVLCSQSLDLKAGEQIHGLVFNHRLENDVRTETALIDIYFKCGNPEAGLRIFSQSLNRNLVMWSAVISNCAQSNCPTKALELFHDFMSEYGFPDSLILLAVLRACSSLTFKSKRMEIHGLAIKLAVDSDIFVGGAIVDLYEKCGEEENVGMDGNYFY